MILTVNLLRVSYQKIKLTIMKKKMKRVQMRMKVGNKDDAVRAGERWFSGLRSLLPNLMTGVQSPGWKERTETLKYTMACACTQICIK